MELKLYNTLTRKEEPDPFRPLDPKRVRMYVCGPTVYDFAHIGNARPLIVFDVLYRLLRHIYGPDHVKYVRNVTDVDDKINARAVEEYPDLTLNRAIRKVTERTERQFRKDVKALGCLPPTVEPRATEYIRQMIKMISVLMSAGYAYLREGHVLFDVSKKADYGKLSNRTIDEMIAGARVEVAPYKKGPMDFVLWKPSPRELPGWKSPWGRGRPGWHIECSAMGDALLGRTFDIHGGGIDLAFPHHENEIAQSECAHHGAQLAQVWMHNGFLQVEGEKMSKSSGNFVTISDLFNGWRGHQWQRAEIRLMMLSTHYRQPIDWTYEGLEEARRIVIQWEKLTANVQYDKIIPSEAVLDPLYDDLNTPETIFNLHASAKAALSSEFAANKLYADLVFLGIFADRKAQDLKLIRRLNVLRKGQRK